MINRCINVDDAGQLLDFRGRPDGRALSVGFARAQLEGAVAAHNLLQTTGLAYVADEVGTGKTLVAAGALALLRHQDPSLRALILAPRANLQRKWAQELGQFARHNLRYSDMRVRGPGSAPVRPTLVVENLRSMLTSWQEQPDTDVIARLSSFSLPHRRGDVAGFVDGWRGPLGSAHLPTVGALLDAAAAGDGDAKELVAACANRLLPHLDVLVVDEAHNLKGGLGGEAARNQVLWTLLGHNPKFLGVVPGYGPRTERILLLSATPMEDTSAHVLGQLDVLGHEVTGFAEGDEAHRLHALRSFLFRRLTKLDVGGQLLTRNRYREEWRVGGTRTSSEPLALDDDRGRLTFALVQKTVADALNHAGGTRRLQIGMLTSFESLASTAARVQTAATPSEESADANEAEGTFDDAEQNRGADDDERRGIDYVGVRSLVESHQREFGAPPSHPKMDAEVERLVEGARRGRKALVFTRRVASVDELVQRVNDRLDQDLRERLASQLPSPEEAEQLWDRYRQDRTAVHPSDSEVRADDEEAASTAAEDDETVEDAELRAGSNLFHWLFRKRPDGGLLTGYWLRQRLEQGSGAYRTLLEDNHVAAALGVPARQALSALAGAVGLSDAETSEELDREGAKWLGAAAEPSTIVRFRAAQRAGLQLLHQKADGAVASRAGISLNAQPPPTSTLAYRHAVRLDVRGETLASLLRVDTELCGQLWHPTLAHEWADDAEYTERRWRWELLTTTLRFDAPALDLWLTELRRHGRLSAGGHQPDQSALAQGLLAELRRQRDEPSDRWTSFQALCALADDAPLILQVNDVNQTDQGRPPWMGSRAPVVGMSGRVNQTAVRQFRTPTYPLVIITTDLLQEGEDLHTFCDEVHHYGMAWMPSSLEQRTGRVDRVNSLTERRLAARDQLDDDGRPPQADRLNVLYPYISGTYEEIQARTVLRRLDEHVRLLHSPFGESQRVDKHLDVNTEITAELAPSPPLTNLCEPYPIDPSWLLGTAPFPVVDGSRAEDADSVFAAVGLLDHLGALPVTWLPSTLRSHLVGECRLPSGRVQPVDLRLTSQHGRAAVRTTSPVGRLSRSQLEGLVMGGLPGTARIGAVRLGPRDRRTFTATAEDVVVLPPVAAELDGLVQAVGAVLDLADALERNLLGSDLPAEHFADDLNTEAQGA